MIGRISLIWLHVRYDPNIYVLRLLLPLYRFPFLHSHWMGTDRKKEALSYRQQHKLSSNLASRLGPPRRGGSRSRESGSRSGSRSKGNAVAIAEAYRRRRQKRKEELMHHDQEMQKGKRLAKLLNEHRTRDRGPRRETGLTKREEDLDKRITEIRQDDRKRLERQEEIRKDRQLYG